MQIWVERFRKGEEEVKAGHIGKDERGIGMDEEKEIRAYLLRVIEEEGCGVSCEKAEIFKDQEGWKMMLEGFMEPWSLGKSVSEAKARIKEYASQGFGLA